jgi:hypothetical protein
MTPPQVIPDAIVITETKQHQIAALQAQLQGIKHQLETIQYEQKLYNQGDQN